MTKIALATVEAVIGPYIKASGFPRTFSFTRHAIFLPFTTPLIPSVITKAIVDIGGATHEFLISGRTAEELYLEINNVEVTPPSAFDDVWGWWRADTFTGSNPTITLTDLSGNGRNMTQVAGTLTPGTAANGQARMVGNATARLTNSATLNSWPCTIITIGRRTAGATCGFFGHQGASPFNSLWAGYESLDRHFIYNGNATNNTTTDGGQDSCWVARIGWGSRVPFRNGLILADQILANIVRSSALAVSLGTEYRGLNFDFQETLVWNRELTIRELDEVHAYVNTRYGMSIPLWSSYTPVNSLVLRGQSNASGRGDRGASDVNIPAEYDTALTGVNVWHGTVTALIGNAFQTLNINDNNHMLGENGAALTAQTFVGMETALTKEYIDRVGGEVYLHKWALGGTQLEYTASAPGHWDAFDTTPVQNNGNRNYANAMRNWWLAMRAHQIAGRRPNIIGDIWYQGEQDATNSTNANNYSANLQAFVSQSRREMGLEGKFYLCRLHIDCPETFASTVRAQQELAQPLIPNSVLVNTDPYGTRGGDPVHISVTGQLALGTFIASQL